MNNDQAVTDIRQNIAKMNEATGQPEFTSLFQRTNHDLMVLRLSKRIDPKVYAELQTEFTKAFQAGKNRYRLWGI